MSQDIRRRVATSAGTTDMQRNDTHNDDEFLSSRSGAGLSAPVMMRGSPSQSGTALKLHVPLLFSILPTFIQRLVSSIGLLRYFAPKWKGRFLIQIGSFLYKFSHEKATTPKGSPFAIDSVDVQLVELAAKDGDYDGAEFAIRNLPFGFKGVFVVSSWHKKNYYAVPTREDALVWVNSLREGRQEAIVRSMGHANHIPYPKSWTYFDTLAKTFLKSKERIKARMEESSMREMEMSSMGEGGPVPKGYYG